MPESRIRRKAAYTAPPAKSGGPKTNPVWFVPVMLGLMILGLIWIVVFYVTQQEYPIPAIGSWNLIAGFGLIMAGFLMTTRWH
jgi:uncharacterized membrane protein